MRSLLLTVILVTHSGGSTTLSAQQDRKVPEPTLAWVTVGLGGSTEGFAGLGGLDLLVRPHLLSFRLAAVSELFGDEFWDLAILYGRGRHWSRGAATASIGLGLMDGERCRGILGGTCTPLSSRISLPVAARVSWRALPFGGLGLYGFANLNSEQSFAGAVLTIELGRLR